MPIFTDGSTFPFYRFNDFNNHNLYPFESIEKIVYVPENTNLKKDFSKGIKVMSQQHLFDYLMFYILRIVFDVKFEKIREDEINLDSITDKRKFLQIINYKINLKQLENEIEKYELDSNVQIDSKLLINELILFTYKYLFVKFAGLIKCHTLDNLTESMEFNKKYELYLKYKQNLKDKKYSKEDLFSKKTYIDNFEKSFGTDDIDYIEKTIDDLILFSCEKRSLQFLNKIIENNVKINSALTSTKRNKILRPFFKFITVVFFFREYLTYDVDDAILVDRFKKFQLQMK